MHNPYGIKLLARLRVGLSQLRELKLKCNFQRLPRPILQLREAYQNNYSPLSPLFKSNLYSNQRETLFEKIRNIKNSLLIQNDATVVKTFLFRPNGLSDKENAMIIDATIKRYNRGKVLSFIVMNSNKQRVCIFDNLKNDS